MKKQGQRGGFVLGLIVGLLLGLAVALGVALYITKVPIPFINKVPQRTAEQDAEEIQRNKNWNPNAPLAGKAAAKAASGLVSGLPTLPTRAEPAVVTPPAGEAAPALLPSPAALPAPVPVPVPVPKLPEKSVDKKAETKAVAAAASAAATTAADPFIYFVQAGAFVRAEDAEQQRAKLALQGFIAKVLEREQSGRTVYRVRLGPMDSRDEAEGLQRKIEAAGIEANLIRVQR